MKKIIVSMLILSLLSPAGAMCFADGKENIQAEIQIMADVQTELEIEKTKNLDKEKEEITKTLEAISADDSLTRESKISKAWNWLKDFVKKHYVAVGAVAATATVIVLTYLFGPDFVAFVKGSLGNSDIVEEELEQQEIIDDNKKEEVKPVEEELEQQEIIDDNKKEEVKPVEEVLKHQEIKDDNKKEEVKPVEEVLKHQEIKDNGKKEELKSEVESLPMIGMQNPGNACYMISSLQQLFRLPALKSFFEENDFSGFEKSERGTDEHILYHAQRIFFMLKDSDGRSALHVAKLLPHLNGLGYIGEQEDAHELVIRILDACKLYGFKEMNFTTELQYRVASSNEPLPNKTSQDYPTTAITVNLDAAKKNISLEDLMDSYFADESIEDVYTTDLEGEGAPKATVIKSKSIVEAPECLAINLGRFSFDYNTFTTKKLNNVIDIPQSVDLAPYMKEGYEGSTKYKLVGVQVHSGTADMGHYYSYVKNGDKDEWVELNDSLVCDCGSYENIRKCISGESEQGKSAYMLYYIKES